MNTFTNLWQSLCKKSDDGERTHFSVKFDMLIEFTLKNGTAGETKLDAEIQWLRSLKLKKKRKVGCVLHLATSDIWASLYTKSGGISFSYFTTVKDSSKVRMTCGD